MKLIHAIASPFARKACVVIIELDLQDRVELVQPGAVTPVSNNDEVNAHNPLGMIPTLTLDDGSSLYDSPVICEYLNHIGNGRFFPDDPIRRFPALKLQALGDGIMDLSVALRYETALRPENLRWPDWIQHQNEKIDRALGTLEQNCGEFSNDLTIGELSVACALGYRDFRFADTDWRDGHPALAKWFADIMQRTSFSSTVPS